MGTFIVALPFYQRYGSAYSSPSTIRDHQQANQEGEALAIVSIARLMDVPCNIHAPTLATLRRA